MKNVLLMIAVIFTISYEVHAVKSSTEISENSKAKKHELVLNSAGVGWSESTGVLTQIGLGYYYLVESEWAMGMDIQVRTNERSSSYKLSLGTKYYLNAKDRKKSIFLSSHLFFRPEVDRFNFSEVGYDFSVGKNISLTDQILFTPHFKLERSKAVDGPWITTLAVVVAAFSYRF